MEKVLGLGKKKVRAGKSAERGEPGDMTSEDHKERKKGKRISRRDLLTASAAATAATAVAVSSVPRVAKAVGNAALDGIETYTENRRVDTSDLKEEVPVAKNSAIVMLGNSNPAGYGTKDGQPLAPRISRAAKRRRGIDMQPVSGAVAGTLARDIPDQYRRVKGKIPKGREQHVGVWATENQPNADPQVMGALSALKNDPMQPRHWWAYLFGRGRVIDSLHRDLEHGINDVLDSGGKDIKSIKVFGASPVHKGNDLEQLVGKGEKPIDIPVSGNSLIARITRIILGDWEHQATKTAAEVARSVKKKRRVTVTFYDPKDDVHHDDFGPTQHFGDEAADRIADKTADSYRRNGNPR